MLTKFWQVPAAAAKMSLLNILQSQACVSWYWPCSLVQICLLNISQSQARASNLSQTLLMLAPALLLSLSHSPIQMPTWAPRSYHHHFHFPCYALTFTFIAASLLNSNLSLSLSIALDIGSFSPPPIQLQLGPYHYHVHCWYGLTFTFITGILIPHLSETLLILVCSLSLSHSNANWGHLLPPSGKPAITFTFIVVLSLSLSL